MTVRATLFLCPILLYLGSADAYEVETHASLSLVAARSSVLADPIVLSRIGLTRPIADGKQTFIGSQAGKLTVEQLIINGARYEDDFPRSIHHFFDPTTNKPLFLSTEEFQGADPNDLGWVNDRAATSPDWALGAACPKDFGCNKYSVKSGRDYFFKGLTSLNNADRQGYMGLTFDTLGRLIHHLQDMAQPQHVRSDAHLHIWGVDQTCKVIKDMDLGILSIFSDKCRTWDAMVRPSAYELWTNQRSVLSTIPTGGYDPVYAPIAPGTDGLTVFNSPLLFWKNSGKGIAEFTNRNFLSENTMYRQPPVTDFWAGVDVDAVALCAASVPPCAVTPAPGDVVTFYSSIVDDQFRPATVTNRHAAANSIFNAEFTQRNPGRYIYTVNRFTFADDHALLLPRAVAYSAGFINYFFRGDMDITYPPEGVYAIMDQNPTNCGTPCGFAKLKVKVRNTTPGTGANGEEPMGSGVLLAVAKYHVNGCDKPDLSGESGSTTFGGDICRSKEEFISVSAPYSVTSVSATTATVISFDFGASPIPISASDLFLQVVFRGQLGQESDAVAVSTVNIAEPNFLAFSNMSDYQYDTLTNKYYPLPQGVSGLDMTNIRLQADGGAGDPIATLSNFLREGMRRLLISPIGDRSGFMFSTTVRWGWTAFRLIAGPSPSMSSRLTMTRRP